MFVAKTHVGDFSKTLCYGKWNIYDPGKKKRKRKSVSAFPFVRDPRAEYEKIRPAPKRGSGKEAVRLTLRDKREKERERENAHCGWYLMWPRRPTVTPLYTYLTTLLYNLSLRAGYPCPFSHLSPPFFVIRSRLDFPRYQSPRRECQPIFSRWCSSSSGRCHRVSYWSVLFLLLFFLSFLFLSVFPSSLYVYFQLRDSSARTLLCQAESFSSDHAVTRFNCYWPVHGSFLFLCLSVYFPVSFPFFL